MKIFAILIASTTLASAGCIEVSKEHIVAGDLFEPVPLFRTLDPAIAVGFAPAAGLQRILSPRELALFARQHDLVVDPGMILPAVCVERVARPISPGELKTALIAAVESDRVSIEVLEYSHEPLVPGRLEFSLAGLNKPPIDAPDAPVIWRGKLMYDGRRSASVWAKVRMTIESPRVVAIEAIPAGTTIRREQVKELATSPYPARAGTLDSAHDVVGKMARRNIPAGQAFLASALEQPREVNKGEHVRVKVIDGLARLSFEAVAESSGRTGDTVVVHNPASGRNFQAVVEDKGSVSVRPPSGE